MPPSDWKKTLDSETQYISLRWAGSALSAFCDPEIGSICRGGAMESSGTRLRKISTKHQEKQPLENVNREEEKDQRWEAEAEPVTPAGLLFRQPTFNCYIIVIVGLKEKINVSAMKQGLQATLVNHRRFSSVMREDQGGDLSWVRRKVDIEDHVIVPAMDDAVREGLVEEYASKLCAAPPMDPSRPMWEAHLLTARTEEAPGGSVVLRFHHSLGDGISLMALLLACTRKVSDPQCLPTIPRAQPRTGNVSRGILAWLWTLVLVLWYTLVDVANFIATSVWMEDSFTPIKGSPGVEHSPKRVLHASIDLQDMKIVKDAVNGTINDVMMAMTSAGLVRYLDRRCGSSVNGAPEAKSKGKYRKNLLVRSAVLVNTRPAPGVHELAEMLKDGKRCGWGNKLGYMLIRFPMARYHNLLDYARAATEICKKKKLSLEAHFSYASGKLLVKLAGIKAAAFLTYRIVSNTTFSFSNVVGPVEEVQFFGNPITHIVPTVCGQPHAMTIHFQSYMGKVKLVMNVAEDVIHDPEQLCSDCIDALRQMKQEAIAATCR